MTILFSISLSIIVFIIEKKNGKGLRADRSLNEYQNRKINGKTVDVKQ